MKILAYLSYPYIINVTFLAFLAAILLKPNYLIAPSAADEHRTAAGKTLLTVTVTTITDGDSLRAGPFRLRLHGIDAPEAKQTCFDASYKRYPCGYTAHTRLAELVSIGDVLTCELKDVDRYKRLIAQCHDGDVNINKEMVQSGWAVAYRRYSSEYVRDEDQARQARKGLWAGQFQTPEEWRRAH